MEIARLRWAGFYPVAKAPPCDATHGWGFFIFREDTVAKLHSTVIVLAILILPATA
jgi:hypothetical protein